MYACSRTGINRLTLIKYYILFISIIIHFDRLELGIVIMGEKIVIV